MKNILKPSKSLLLCLMLLLCLISFPMAALAQTAEQDSPPTDVQGPVVVGTVIDAEATATLAVPVDQPDTNAPPESTDIEKAIANFINALPAMFGFGLLVGLIGYLIRERTELIQVMSNVMSEDMATSIFDTFLKGVLSIASGVNQIIPGQADDDAVDNLAKDGGLKRVRDAKGKTIGWEPIQGFTFETAPTQLSPFAGMQRVALADGTYAYKPGSATGQQRTFNADGSYTLDTAAFDPARESAAVPGYQPPAVTSTPGNPYAEVPGAG